MPTTPPSPASAFQEASGTEGDHTGQGDPTGLAPAPVTTITGPDEPPEETALHAAVPAQF
jgi:hypothetical protein